MLGKKQKKEFEYRCKSFKKKNKELLLELSPLKDFADGEWEWDKVDDKFFCSSDRYRKTRSEYKGKGYYLKDYETAIAGLINADSEISAGNIEYIEERSEHLNTCSKLIGCINNKKKIEFVSKLIDKSGLSDSTLFLLKMVAYGTIEIYDDYSTELTRICIGTNKIKTIVNAADEGDLLLESLFNQGKGGKTMEIMQYELDIIKDKLERGETIRLYRGFTVKGDERVRKGYKKDGDAYFKQDSGTGISYSLSKDVAGYFALRGLTMKDGNFLPENRFYSGKISSIMQAPQFGNLISDKKYVKERAKDISLCREVQNLKPIVCEYILEPEMVKGFFLQLGEGELMSLPEDVKVKRYEIPSSKDLAKYEYNWVCRGVSVLPGIAGGLIENGITCWVTNDKYGKVFAHFAVTEDVKDDADELIDVYFSDAPQAKKDRVFMKFIHSMEYNAIELPESVKPEDYKLTKRLWDYLKKPIDVVKNRGTSYRIGTKKD